MTVRQKQGENAENATQSRARGNDENPAPMVSASGVLRLGARVVWLYSEAASSSVLHGQWGHCPLSMEHSVAADSAIIVSRDLRIRVTEGREAEAPRRWD